MPSLLRRTLFIAVLGCTIPCAADESTPAGGPKISYEQHVKPIFREHCLKCHNADEQKGGLALDSFGATMSGGASGEVVFAEELDSSRLWALVHHDEKPVMPPNSDRLDAEKLALIKQWIEQGALESAGSKKAATKKPSWEFKPAGDVSDGAGAMPENWLRQPVTTTARAGQIASLACSPRAPVIAIAGHRQVTLYHTETSQLLGVSPFPEGVPYVVRFSRDGGLLMVGGGRAAHSGYVALCDVISGRRVARVGDELDAIMTADIDASLQSIAIGDSGKRVKVFDIGSGEVRFENKKHTEWVTAVSFSPDGKWLTSGDRAGGLIVWEADTGREYMVFDGHQQPITSISWRADSQVFATSSEDGNVRVWSKDNKKAIRSFATHGPGATWVEFTNSGDFITTGRDNYAKLWDGNGKAKLTYGKMTDIALRATVSFDGQRVFVGDWAGNVKVSNIDKAEHMGALLANPPELSAQLAQARQRLEERKQAAAAAAAKKQAVALEVVEATKKRDAAVTQLAAIQTKMRDLETQSSALQQQLQQIDEQLGKQQASIDPAQVVVNDLENTLKIVATAVAAAESETQAEAKARDAQAQVCQQMEASQRMFADRDAQLSGEIAIYEKHVAELQPQLTAAEEELAAVEEKRKATAEAIESAEVPAEESVEEPHETSEIKAHEDLALAERLSGQLSEQVKRLQGEITSAQQSLAAAQQRLEFFRASYGE